MTLCRRPTGATTRTSAAFLYSPPCRRSSSISPVNPAARPSGNAFTNTPPPFARSIPDTIWRAMARFGPSWPRSLKIPRLRRPPSRLRPCPLSRLPLGIPPGLQLLDARILPQLPATPDPPNGPGADRGRFRHRAPLPLRAQPAGGCAQLLPARPVLAHLLVQRKLLSPALVHKFMQCLWEGPVRRTGRAPPPTLELGYVREPFYDDLPFGPDTYAESRKPQPQSGRFRPATATHAPRRPGTHDHQAVLLDRRAVIAQATLRKKRKCVQGTISQALRTSPPVSRRSGLPP